MKTWNFDNDKPIFRQISDRLKTDIACGKYPPGVKFPSVRELALQVGVNPNTVQRALSEMESEGVLESKRGDGRYVTEDENLKNKLLQNKISIACSEFIVAMRELGLEDRFIIESLTKEIDNSNKKQ